MAELDDEAMEILRAATCVLAGTSVPPFAPGRSERVIETPWVASYFKGGERVLDVGFTMSSLDYLGLLLELRRAHRVTIEAVDIVKPERVARRYPAAWLDAVTSTPIAIGDVRTVPLPPERYDVVTCISTIEHVGFDEATVANPATAFARSETPDRVKLQRDPEVNHVVLRQFHSALRRGGLALVSVPMGKGGPMMVRDSLGLYGAYWEYDLASWREITHAPGFELVEERFARLDGDHMWRGVAGPADLINRIALDAPVTGCAVVALRKL